MAAGNKLQAGFESTFTGVGTVHQVSETILTDLKKKVPGFTDDLEAGVGSQLNYHQASPCFHPSQKNLLFINIFIFYKKCEISQNDMEYRHNVL
jgi:hypothetical protein